MRTWKLLSPLATLVAIIALAGCGGSDSSTDSSTAPSGGSTEATTQGGPGAGSDTLASAAERLTEAETPQEELPLTTPLRAAPKPGQTIAVMSCDDPNCRINTEAIEEAADSVGLKVKTLSFQFANPATLVASMKTALQFDPIATILVGLPQATWASVMPEYEAKGVAIIGEGTSPATLEKTFIASIPTTADAVDFGRPLADWIAVDSKGKGKILYQEAPEIGNVELFQQGVEEELGEVCPECEMSGISVSLNQIGSGESNQAVISQLRADPEIKYVIIANGAWSTGLPNSLEAAGLDDVKILGVTPENEQFAGLENGTQAAWNSFSIRQCGFQAVDAALRYAQEMKIPSYDGVTGTILVTKKNVGTLSQEAKDLGAPPPYDYEGAFEALWHAE